MTVIGDQRKQHKNGQKDYKRRKKNDQKTNKTTRTTIIQNYQKEQTRSQLTKLTKMSTTTIERAFRVVALDARENPPLFSTTLFSYQSFLQPQRVIIVFVVY